MEMMCAGLFLKKHKNHSPIDIDPLIIPKLFAQVIGISIEVIGLSFMILNNVMKII